MKEITVKTCLEVINPKKCKASYGVSSYLTQPGPLISNQNFSLTKLQTWDLRSESCIRRNCY